MVSAFIPLCVVAGLVLLIGLAGQYEPATLESQTTIRGGGGGDLRTTSSTDVQDI